MTPRDPLDEPSGMCLEEGKPEMTFRELAKQCAKHMAMIDDCKLSTRLDIEHQYDKNYQRIEPMSGLRKRRYQRWRG